LAGVELKIMNSGDHLRKGTWRFELSGDPLDVWLFKVDQYGETLLLVQLPNARVVPTSGERIWPELGFWGVCREKERECRRRGNGKPRVRLGGGGYL
jgi:hypothetical protein